MAATAFDGYYTITEKADGHYVEVFAPTSTGKAVTVEEIEEGLRKKGVRNFDLSPVIESMTKDVDHFEVKVSGNTLSSEEAVGVPYKIEIGEDRMRAYITFFPTEKEMELNPESLERELRSRNVLFGINVDVLKEIAVEHRMNYPYLVAEGEEPVDPIPGHVEHFFETGNDYAPEVDEEGNVNFHKLSVISNVKEGDLLARVIQTVPGKSGKNLSGTEISAKKGKPVRIRYGKNTRISDDKMELYAAKNGLVRVFDNKIVVNDVYEVPNHVGNSTGDIDFDGSVIVHGNIITGFTVKARGDIEVMGVVEGATVIAGGTITLHSGIQGMGKSHVEAGGDLLTKFIEQADVVCGGDIYSEAILHSKVSCKGQVTVEGKKGMISGGTVRAGVSVMSRTLGSHMGTQTDVEVGIDPALLEEYNELKLMVPKMTEEADKLEKVIQLLNKRKELAGKLEDDKVEMYKSAIRNKVFLTNKINISQKRLEELKEEVNNRHSGTVKVAGVMYSGVHIGIGNAYYHVKEELKYVTLYKDGPDIKLTAL